MNKFSPLFLNVFLKVAGWKKGHGGGTLERLQLIYV